MTIQTYGELRQHLLQSKIPWTVNPKFADNQPIQRHPLGALTQPPPAVPTRRVDVTALVRAAPPTNSLLARDLLTRGILTNAH
ncbi:hypothetical protein CEF00_12375, partial [Lactobacillus crispatus]|uniref:hypothetical protein n=1 Tax=Lactobacillus crispatus TaxID=47770 RepID=UPI00106060D3